MKSNDCDRQLCWHRRQVQWARDCHAGSHSSHLLPLPKHAHLPSPLPFPDGCGTTVHFRWPGGGFQLLGMCVLPVPCAAHALNMPHARQALQ
ncbi:hypothetical protein B0H21DRAFT_741463 [Amylocystis lapponica]|nr:hypothetical protein B0H21DRAFT_741463 [Amylocystis lapponica]